MSGLESYAKYRIYNIQNICFKNIILTVKRKEQNNIIYVFSRK